MSAARELVHRQGVARTTLADIAQAADVPVGNVYYYFRQKTTSSAPSCNRGWIRSNQRSPR